LAITDIIWANKTHGINEKVSHIPKSEAGLNFSDLELYELVTQGFYLRHIVKYAKEELWVHIEDAHAHPQNIFMCLFSKNGAKNINNFIV
jgi:hypothetical protein